MKKLLFIFCLCTLFACGDDDNGNDDIMEVVCPTEVRYAFRITVLNAADDTPLENVTIRARENMFEEVLEEESPGVYVGLEDRTGAYQLILEKEGFQTIINSQDSLEEDNCGIITQELEFELEPM